VTRARCVAHAVSGRAAALDDPGGPLRYSVAMACPHCAIEENLLASGWCRDCERAFGIWGRRYATDIVSTVLVGMAIVLVGGMGLPLLGFNWLLSASSILVSFGAMLALYQFHDRRRRRQFLDERLPRAYVMSGT
jgi:hypothetical protein